MISMSPLEGVLKCVLTNDTPFRSEHHDPVDAEESSDGHEREEGDDEH
jgi:hypothetical protein